MKQENYKDLHILVIDDEPFMRKLIERMLLDIGFGSVTQAQNGLDALKKLRNQPSIADLIVCDLEMPETYGFEFVEKLRQIPDPKFANLPVLILTGYSDQSHLEQAVRLKIHGFLAKPVSRAALESRVVKAMTSSAIDPDILSKWFSQLALGRKASIRSPSQPLPLARGYKKPRGCARFAWLCTAPCRPVPVPPENLPRPDATGPDRCWWSS